MHLRHLIGVALLVAVTATAEEADTKLSTTTGAYVRLADVFRGRPAVVFYEDKDSTTLNLALKQQLFAEAKQRNLLDAVSLAAIANVRGYDWFPARRFVVSSVKDCEKEFGVPVYLDWDGTMTRAPWSLKPEGATVLLLDKTGAVVFSRTGALSERERGEVIDRLAGLLAR